MSEVGSILTNAGALEALNSIAQTSSALISTQTELTTGRAVSSPVDNPSGYITAQGFTLQIGGDNQALQNANQGVSLAQTAQGGIQQQIGVAQQLYSIAVQAANATETSDERQSLQSVTNQLVTEINDIATNTQFNGKNLLDGTFQGVQFQIGANEGQTSKLSIASTNASQLGTVGSLWTSVVDNTSEYANPLHPGTYISNSSDVTNTGDGHNNTPGSMVIDGAQGSATISVSASESAYSLAQSINAASSSTGVSATAKTTFSIKLGSSGNGRYTSNIKVTRGLAGGSFTLAMFADRATASSIVSTINASTATTGLSVTESQGGILTFSQASGKTVQFDNVSDNLYTSSGVDFVRNQHSSGPGNVNQFAGQVEMTSKAQFNLKNGSFIGLENKSTHGRYLSSMNLSTQSGAQDAIGVIQSAIGQLEAEAAGVGAFQDGLQALTSNLQQSLSNATSALGGVQDANLPQAANTLSQEEIQAQTGVAALQNSTALQQSYLSLLP